MAYAHFDTSPVTVDFDHNQGDVQPVVYIHDVEIWRGEWEP